MKILHTSDWHVGKKIRGNSRIDEHRAVLAEITEHAGDYDVDVVLIAGDLFESSAPTPESEELVYRTLLDLADTGASVALIGGNHDNTRRLSALRPLFDLGNVHVVAEPARPADGSVIEIDIDGEALNLAMLPFVSQRGIVRAGDLMGSAAFEHVGAYADRLRMLVETLTAGFTPDSVNVLMVHAFVLGGALGGGERSSHVALDYAVPATIFPLSATYVALGHLHRPQKVPGATAIHYCGSPLQLDFGESGEAKQVNLVEAHPGKPAAVTPVALRSGTPLETISGTFDELADAAGDVADVWLRVIVSEPRRAGLADDVRALFGEHVVQVDIDALEDDRRSSDRAARIGRSPHDLFVEYLATRGVSDSRLTALFDELLEAADEPALQ